MEVLPRFPMFGGWKTDFYIGYDVPASDFLSVDASDSSRYVLNMSFASPFPQAAIDELEVRVILPEFANSIQCVAPLHSAALPI
jgi:oligosaccharyltransferase complex subunit alpha (ribophorin I)